MVSFDIVAEAGEARRGRLHLNGKTLDTPHLFPVINFYGGGNEGALFGGGVHRTVKEFLVNHPPTVGENDYSDLFPGVMTSISSLTDYGIREKKLDWYLSNEIREWDAFSDYDGAIYADSGGYKILKQGGLQGKNFEKDVDQDKAFDMQMKLGPDLIVNLDHPLHPDDDFDERLEKMEKTAKNARRLAERRDEFDGSVFLTVHGYYRRMLERSFDMIEEELETDIQDAFDGIALGSLVPRKDSTEDLIEAVTDCKLEMQERGMELMPLHVFGISGSTMPLLVALGADSFDSASYLHQAVNGKYCTHLFETIPLDEANFEECGCRVCSDWHLVEQMQGNAEHQKDVLGPVAVHNLAIQQRELRKMLQIIAEEGQEQLADYIEDAVKDQKGFRKFAYRVINETIRPYFEESDPSHA